MSAVIPMSSASRVRTNWPEYLIEAWGLGTFMVSASVFATLFEAPASPVRAAIGDGDVRRALVGVAMGLTAIALIYSPWGKRSGAHMNPAVTLTFLRLGKVHRIDAAFFIAAQFVGGMLGVLLSAALLGPAFTAAPVSYAVTLPGSSGPTVAFVAEYIISALLMFAVLTASNAPRIAPFTGLIAGGLVATYIAIEAPFSGMSMNPARTFASAAPSATWMHFWIYLVSPVLGMLSAAQIYLLLQRAVPRRLHAIGCAKLLHPDNQRCIHCGHERSVQS